LTDIIITESLTKDYGAVDTIVVLMGVGSLESTVSDLLDGGLDADVPVAIIEWGTTERQSCLHSTLGKVVEDAKVSGVKPPAVIVVGEVVELGRRLSWFRAPLCGRTVVLTRPAAQAKETGRLVEQFGGKPYYLPTIEIVGASSVEECEAVC